MWAPHPVVCFAESQTAHCASGGPESETGANSSPAIPDCSVASSINFDNDMHTQEEQFPCTNNDASQEFDYAGDGEEEQAFSNESDAESAVDHDHETHIPLSFQIPLDVLRTAMQASPSSQAAYYSHRLYRGPEDQALSVHYCRNMEVAEKVAKYFVDDKVLGFDIEWKPWSSATSIKGNASLIQIASEDRIALFHISLFDGETADELMPPTLKAILASPRIYKVGVAIKGDFSRLEKHLGVKARGVFEISRLHNLVEHYATDPSKINKRLVSLANQTKQHLQLPLFKGEVRESDWSKPLTPDQIQYAATDAYAGLRIFDVLEYKRKLLKPTPPIPDTCDVDVPTIRRLNAKSAMAMAMAKEKARKAAEEIQQDDEDSDAYQTAPEELMDSHELEDLPVPVDLSTHPQLKARRVGRLDFSRLKGVDPGYPILPRPRSEDENESDSSQVSQPVDTDAEMDESADKELEERLSTMQIDDLSATDGGKYGSGSEYMAAETWAQSYLVQTIPSAASSSVASPPSKIRATVPHLRAYHLWHHQCLSLENIAGQLREPPLSLTTVMSYITQAVDLEKLEYRRDDMKEVLRGMPIGLRMGRYRRLMERVGGLY
ncbi:ribonuclease H-like protein [Pleomassaria siparia CBS 279.74]|uniref:Ribonuclease H-like protein n=1 Tax=Pleomassaria siparia CBS 279.74 TaxID=1314801 RepID=A0A6G1KBU1_9PLEO|nr:ribonuclease H-like protein [Pleomassaria siparia CBS 279.74]